MSALFTLGGLSGLGGIVMWGANRVFTAYRISEGLSAVGSLFFAVMRGADATTLDKIARGFSHVVVWMVLAATVSGITWMALTYFHEPVRISILVGGLSVVIAVPLRYGMFKVLSAIAGRLARGAWGRMVARFGMISALIAFFGGTVLILVYRYELVGVYDPYPFIVVLWYFSLLFVVAPLVKRVGKRMVTGLVPGLSVSALLLGTVVASGTDSGRMQADTNGAIGGVVYRSIHNLLDMDRDGSAWLIGSDCHPFDPNAGAFAPEIPNNGYDENCDGKDTLVDPHGYVDPLTQLPRFPDSRRVRNGNVLLIISDATSAKHLAMYGNRRDTMPNLERFAKNATIFENAFAAANHTSIAMPAILTGQFPSVFPLVKEKNWNSFDVPKWAKPVQRRFAKKHYETYMLAGHRLYGFLRYFKHVENGNGKRLPAETLGEMTLARLEKIGPHPKNPVFVAAHFIDPHHGYKAETDPYKFGKRQSDRYERELNYVDEALGPILDLMSTTPYQDWLVIVTSDHGEAFSEHSTYHHGNTLYDEEVRIPFIMRVPNTRASRVAMSVSHADIVPTLIDWCGLAEDDQLSGHSLLPLTLSTSLDGRAVRRVVYAEFFRTGEEYGAFDGRYSLFYNNTQDKYELYDGVTDPRQRDDIYQKGSDPLLEGLLNSHIRASQARLRKGDRIAEKAK